MAVLGEPRLPLTLPSVVCGLEGLGKNFRVAVIGSEGWVQAWA